MLITIRLTRECYRYTFVTVRTPLSCEVFWQDVYKRQDSDEATTDDTKSDSTDMPGESIEESDDSTSETAGITKMCIRDRDWNMQKS